jgi:hypothetical protein
MAGDRQAVWCDDSCKTIQQIKFILTAFQQTEGEIILSGADLYSCVSPSNKKTLPGQSHAKDSWLNEKSTAPFLQAARCNKVHSAQFGDSEDLVFFPVLPR